MNTIPCGTFHNIVYSQAQVASHNHLQNHQSCEDSVFMRTTPDYLFCGLADGQSGAEYGAEGGRVCLESVFDYVNSVGIEMLLNPPFPDELPCTIVKAFRKELLSLKKSKQASLKEFASTLLAIAVDLKTGKYILIHLGDGCAIGIPQVGDPTVISAPENGLTPYHTWLTTSDNTVSHLRIAFGSFENKRRILLMSDGSVCFCRGRNIPRRAKELLKDGSQLQLNEHLLQSDPTDDATCIVLDFCNIKQP